MKTVRLLALSTTILVFGGPAFGAESRTAQAIRHSAPKGITEALYTCIDKAGLDQTLLGKCVAAERGIQDARLNKAYGQLMTKLDDRTKEAVKVAERAWLDFNVKTVAAETAIGGTNQVANFDVANSELFRYCERANVLEDYLFSVGE
ncbi:MAG: lysozyme inhibitor LprI family protein [Luteibacter sp.]|uniref:lysozyme inhibitor LprI family protein n=1 Tax=Luteibacter sp. TaxID=1886636 RepID=UPI0028093DA4|nr:lysozyme inhibitor LprI family protein [Luteibacter sp.]MDQ7994375.1 lysozyme inhibitor LprI family protein [Luteibacter sp.]MDQ8048676.1 lysozyme inhibitor LprI family protein [Luteibacter sp.]